MTWEALSLHPNKDAIMASAPAALSRLVKRSGKQWPAEFDQAAAISQVQAIADGLESPYNLDAIILNDSHLLVFIMGGPWYAPKANWLIEQFFVRVGPGPLGKAIEALDEFAVATRATGALMGTSLARNDTALGRLYRQHGFVPEASQHYKAYT